MKQALSAKQMTFRVIYLGLCLMIIYTAFGSIRIIISQTYRENGYDGLGEVSIIVVYFLYGSFTFFAVPIINKLGYKKTMFLSSLGFTIYSLTGFILEFWPDLPHPLGWIIVLFGATLCGISESLIWIAQGSYIALIAGTSQKSILYGLFWAIFMFNQVLGNIIITFILGLINKIAYFLILTFFGCISSVMLLFLKNIEKEASPQEPESNEIIKQEFTKVFDILKEKRLRSYNMYLIILGSSTGFYITYLYAIIVKTLPEQTSDQTKEQYESRLHYYEGWVFIVLGIAQVLVGIAQNRIGDKICRFKKAYFASAFFTISALASLINYFWENYPFCFLIGVLWGGFSVYIQTIVGDLVAYIFPQRVQAGFSAYNCCYGIGLIVIVIVNLLLQNQPAWILLSILFIIGIYYFYLGSQLKYLSLQKQLKKDARYDQLNEENVDNNQG